MIDWLPLRNFEWCLQNNMCLRLWMESGVTLYKKHTCFYIAWYIYIYTYSSSLVVFPSELEVQRCSVLEMRPSLSLSKWLDFQHNQSHDSVSCSPGSPVLMDKRGNRPVWASKREREREDTWGRGGESSPVLSPITFDFICRPLSAIENNKINWFTLT